MSSSSICWQRLCWGATSFENECILCTWETGSNKDISISIPQTTRRHINQLLSSVQSVVAVLAEVVNFTELSLHGAGYDWQLPRRHVLDQICIPVNYTSLLHHIANTALFMVCTDCIRKCHMTEQMCESILVADGQNQIQLVAKVCWDIRNRQRSR